MEDTGILTIYLWLYFHNGQRDTRKRVTLYRDQNCLEKQAREQYADFRDRNNKILGSGEVEAIWQAHPQYL